MPIFAVALFGSRARGDHDANSDVDLLLVTSELRPRHVVEGSMSLSFYPKKHLSTKAKQGDLFVFHLVMEAKVVYDESKIFERIRKSFRLREHYTDEIANASAVGWFLVRHGIRAKNAQTINRRIAWCVRTILIARAAEAGRPVFAADALAEFAGASVVKDIIQNKSSAKLSDKVIVSFKKFLIEWGANDLPPAKRSRSEYLRVFEKTHNVIGLQAYRGAMTAPAGAYH